MSKNENSLFPGIISVKSAEAKTILEKTEIVGDTFNGIRLTCDYLAKQGLEPRNKIVLDKAIVYFSDPFNVESSRIAIVAYVQIGESVLARSYYRSNSQAIWRFLPDYRMADGFLDWYSLGHSDETIMIPLVLQKALSEIRTEPSYVRNIVGPDLVLAGTAFNITSQDNRFKKYKSTTNAIQLEGNFYFMKGRKVPPEKVVFNNEEQEPDFSKVITSWTKDSSIYGEIRVEIFYSRDKKFFYMFCRDNIERAWIGGVEQSTGNLTSYGLKEEWVYAGDLVTPAFEYKSLAGNYGNDELHKGSYIDMFKFYNSKIPIIKKYLKGSS